MPDAAANYSNTVLCQIAVPNVAVKFEANFKISSALRYFKDSTRKGLAMFGDKPLETGTKKKILPPNNLKPD